VKKQVNKRGVADHKPVFNYRFDSPLQSEIHQVVQSSVKEQNTNQEKRLKQNYTNKTENTFFRSRRKLHHPSTVIRQKQRTTANRCEVYYYPQFVACKRHGEEKMS